MGVPVIGPGRAVLLLVALLAAFAAPVAAEVGGRVVAASGRPVAQARVARLAGGPIVFTGPDGRFVLPGAEPPVEISIAHPRFVGRTFTLTAETAAGDPIVLEAKREVYEEIVVTAARGGGDSPSPPSIAASRIEPAKLAAAPATLAEAVVSSPGVAENGQGGLFQVVSVRGVSRLRVLTLVAGMQVTSERRAGVAGSFVDPLLVGEIDVVRGPSSTWYGSGALGGVVELFPRRFEAASSEVGWSSSGDETWQTAGWGDDRWSAAVAHRRSGDAETPRGERLFSRYERWSGAFERIWGGGDGAPLWEATVLPSLSTDIGKPNSDFPGRTTLYPREEHLLARIARTAPSGLRASVWAHPSSLETRVERSTGRLDLETTEALNFGVDARRTFDLAPALSATVGLEHFGRRGVDSRERQLAPDGRLVAAAHTLDGAEQDEAATYGSLRWTLPRATLEAGGRYTRHRQENLGADVDDDAWNGFAGAVLPLGRGFQASANVGTGLRFPSLSERFFSGTTGRGEVVANAGLDPERSISGDLGLAWFGRRLHLAAHVFRNEIDGYVERVELAPDVLTFVNLVSGTVEGVELDGFWEAAPGWLVSWGGHAIDGRSADGSPLADIPPDRVQATLAADPRAGLGGGRWTGAVGVERRSALASPGPGEVAIPSAVLISGNVALRLTESLALTVRGTNLTDELYLPSADDKAVPAPGRSVGLSLRWTAAP